MYGSNREVNDDQLRFRGWLVEFVTSHIESGQDREKLYKIKLPSVESIRSQDIYEVDSLIFCAHIQAPLLPIEFV